MAKLVLAALVMGVVASTEVSVPLDSAPDPFAVGFASGFVSDSPVLMTCGMQLGAEAVSFMTALKDFKKSLTTMPLNLTAIESSIKEIQDAAKNIPDVKDACKPLKQALVDLWQQLRQLHGPKATMEHVLYHITYDGEKIFGNLHEAEKAYKTGWDYMTAGQNMGMAVRRMLVGEMNNTIVPHEPIPGCHMKIREGMAMGFVSDSPTFMDCHTSLENSEKEFKTAAADLRNAVSNGLNMTEIMSALGEFKKAFEDGMSAKKECKDDIKKTEDDVKQILAKLMPLKGIVGRMVHNFFGNSEAIFDELSKAAEAHKNKDCLGAGRQMGMAFRRTLVGEINSTNIIVV